MLISVLVLLALSACGSDEPGNTQGDDPETPGTIDDGPEEPEDPEGGGRRLPFEPAEMNLGGRVFTIGASGWGAETTSYQRCVIAEEMNGESINDAVFVRNAALEELFNIKIEQRWYEGGGDLHTGIRNAVNAGDNVFDAAYIRFGGLNTLSTGGFLLDFYQIPHIELTNPWWDQNSVEQISINHKLFAVNGDIQILDKGALNVLLFNKQLQAEYQVEDLYGLVKGGQWTLGKMLEISRQVSADLNGDGMMDEHDRYGLLYYRDSIPAFLVGAGEYIARKDADDLPVMSFNTERVYSVLDSMYEVLYDTDVAFHTMIAFQDAGFIIYGNAMFQNNQSLLKYVRMTEIEGLRGMETDFGILPFPKYNEQQENHLSLVNASIGSALTVPVTADAEISGAVLEAMAYESRYTLIPAYIEITLRGRITRDDDSEAMLDIIYGNMAYDLGGVFDLGGIVGELMYHTMDMHLPRGRGMQSFYERREGQIERDIDRIVEAFLDMG
jgi:hypothetical protein